MSSNAYLLGYKIGKALASFEIAENIVKHYCPNEYKLYKAKIRRLSQYEVEQLMDIILKEKCFSKSITFL